MGGESRIPKYDADTKNNWRGMLMAGLSVMVMSLALLRLLMDNAGEVHGFLMGIGINPLISMHLLLLGVFSPVLIGGLVGWAVGYGAGPRHTGTSLGMLMAAGIALPVALLDPWAIVALGVGEDVFFPLKLVFLSIPVFMAMVCAYSGWSDSHFRPAAFAKNLLLIGLVMITLYIVIYRFILPVGNPTAIPLVQ